MSKKKYAPKQENVEKLRIALKKLKDGRQQDK